MNLKFPQEHIRLNNQLLYAKELILSLYFFCIIYPFFSVAFFFKFHFYILGSCNSHLEHGKKIHIHLFPILWFFLIQHFLLHDYKVLCDYVNQLFFIMPKFLLHLYFDFYLSHRFFCILISYFHIGHFLKSSTNKSINSTITFFAGYKLLLYMNLYDLNISLTMCQKNYCISFFCSILPRRIF